MKEQECADCQWFRSVEVRKELSKDDLVPGVCVSRPPQTIMVAMKDERDNFVEMPQSLYPIITSKTWACGDFKGRLSELSKDVKLCGGG